MLESFPCESRCASVLEAGDVKCTGEGTANGTGGVNGVWRGGEGGRRGGERGSPSFHEVSVAAVN